jgi:hypothetical protein
MQTEYSVTAAADFVCGCDGPLGSFQLIRSDEGLIMAICSDCNAWMKNLHIELHDGLDH